MNDLAASLRQLSEQLSLLRSGGAKVEEELPLVKLLGAKLTESSFATLLAVQTLCLEMRNGARIEIDGVSTLLSDDPLDIAEALGQPWSLQIGKASLRLTELAPIHRSIYLFFFADAFKTWSEQLDPFDPSVLNPECSTIIFVRGLRHPFGSQLLTVCDWFRNQPDRFEDLFPLPSSEEVHQVIHTIGDGVKCVVPKFWALRWGKIDDPQVEGFLYASLKVLGVCLSSDLKSVGASYRVVLRGIRKVEPLLATAPIIPGGDINELCVQVVSWVFKERRETRHKLVVDRLTLDFEEPRTLLECLRDNLAFAFSQAKDSYGFVILERKDAHQKELREFMKDVRGQADLYAAKTRDLVNGLTRDFIAVLLVIGASVLAKIDIAILATPNVRLFLLVFSCYLLFSCTLQVLVNVRDVQLAYRESLDWLSVLRTYTSQKEQAQKFEMPLKKRRRTFHIVVGFFIGAYMFVALVLANLKQVVGWLI